MAEINRDLGTTVVARDPRPRRRRPSCRARSPSATAGSAARAAPARSTPWSPPTASCRCPRTSARTSRPGTLVRFHLVDGSYVLIPEADRGGRRMSRAAGRGPSASGTATWSRCAASSSTWRPGRLVAVTGPSGRRASPRCCGRWPGRWRPTEGRVSYGGTVLAGREQAAGLGVVIVPQGNGLASSLTAAENVLVPLLSTGVGAADAHRRTDAGARAGRPRGVRHPPDRGALRRPAAAGRARPCVRRAGRRAAGRRAHQRPRRRQPGADRGRAAGRGRPRGDRGDGDPRPRGGRARPTASCTSTRGWRPGGADWCDRAR